MSFARRAALVSVLLLAAPVAGCAGDKGLVAPEASPTSPTSSPASSASSPMPSAPASSAPSSPSSSAAQPAGSIFKGKVIGIDPGHNGGNHTAPGTINRKVWNGREYESCNTTGTATDSGFPEASFNWAVANDLASELRRQGARVVMTRTSNNGVGPCVDERAKIINQSRADVAIDIHADGAPAGDRGFSMLVPVRTKQNQAVVASSRRYAGLLRTEMKKTGMPVASYLGSGGMVPRDDLAGLNLTTVPQVLLEIGNMRNATDARLHRSPKFQQAAADAIARAMAAYLTKR